LLKINAIFAAAFVALRTPKAAEPERHAFRQQL
jgi:hypothetical protein